MFDFALKPAPSNEELLMNPGEIERNYVSAGAQQIVLEDALTGIIYSAVAHLVSNNTQHDVINAKMRELVNQFKTNGDITENQRSILANQDFVKNYNFESIYSEVVPHESNDMWDVGYYGILRCVRKSLKLVTSWGSEEDTAKLNEREKALLKALKEARAALDKATEDYWQYTQAQAIMTIDELLKKYADILSKIGQEWYNSLMTSNRYRVEELERLRKAKKTEDDIALERPVEAN